MRHPVAIEPAGRNGLVAEAMTFVEQQDAVGGQFCKVDRLVRCFAARGRQHEWVFE